MATGEGEEALRRFGRLDEARSAGGSGLGLSLVAAVARLHGGTIRLADVRAWVEARWAGERADDALMRDEAERRAIAAALGGEDGADDIAKER